MSLIKLHASNDSPMYIETDKVSSLHEPVDPESKTVVIMDNGMQIGVKESMDDIVAVLDNDGEVDDEDMKDKDTPKK